MTKYKEYYDKMVNENKNAFDKFAKIHVDYGMDEDANQEEFNAEGEKILKIIHEWEDRLCKQSEKAGFGSYTSGLSEKFQAEVKSHFPLIDHIGIIVSNAKAANINKISSSDVNKFSLKKIKLS